MNYDVSIDHKSQIVVTTCKGTLDTASATAMVKDVRKQAFDLGYGLLYDMIDVSVAVSFAQAYAFPRDTQNVYHDPKHRFGRAAVLYKPGKDEDFWKFYENTAQNTGGVVRVFNDKDKALKWLCEAPLA